jgi:hypothetical protein
VLILFGEVRFDRRGGGDEVMYRIVAAAALTIALAGCSQGQTYEIPAAKVRSTLLSLRLPSAMMSGAGAGGTIVTPTDENGVRWTVLSRDSRAQLSLIATIESLGEAETRVNVFAEPANGNDTVAKSMADNPAIVKLYTKAMTEQISAKLENREFDMAAIQTEMMAATIATMPKLQKEAMKRASEFHAMEREMESADGDMGDRPGQPVNQLGERSRSY